VNDDAGPIFRQVAAQIENAIADGSLVRPLMADAQKLGISGRELAAMIDDWEARR
jgi:DNA-binding transcriptional regulator YhcF (GntR family)